MLTNTPASATAAPTTCAITFTDVPPGSAFYGYIMCLACQGIVSGYTDGTFRPGGGVTRGQIAKIVSNAAGFGEPVSGQSFEDVLPGSAFYTFTERMAGRGILSGYPCGGHEPAGAEPCDPQNRPYFRPTMGATRGQIAKIVAQSAGIIDPPGERRFEDMPQGSPFYADIQRLANRGVMDGYACGRPDEPCVPPGNRPYFRSGSNATRGQTSKIVANTFLPNCQTPP